jgi:N-acetyl-alpha-D-glucosaminyl L-malate synthase BshA
MKVLLISVWKPRIGGIVTHVENLIKHSKNDFTILTYWDKESKRQRNALRVPYINLPVLRGASFAFFSFLRALRGDFDIIHAHYSIPQGFAGVLIKKARGKPLLLTVHGSDLTVLGRSRLVQPVLKWIFGSTDIIIAVSSHMKALLIELGVEAEKIRVIYNGAEAHMWAEEAEPRVIFIGALVWQKGVDILIEAFKDIKKKFNDISLFIVGDGPERERLGTLVERLGVGNVEFRGYVADLDPVFTAKSVFVLPSRQEGFGIALLEAMARGVPVVGSKTGGIPEIIRDGKNGFLFTAGNPTSLADAVIKIFEKEDERAKLIKGGLETVKNFTWTKMAEETEDVYKEVTKVV